MSERDEISLRELFMLLWRARWMVIAITMTTAIAAVVIAKILPLEFDATVTISPVSNNTANGRISGQSSSQLGGIASLIGISLGGDSNKAESLAVLQSEALTERYIREHDLLPVLFPDEWDAAAKKWRTTDPRMMPTLWKGNRKFIKLRNVQEDKKTSLVTMTITWTDPQIAAQWANELVGLTNDVLRAKAIRESEQHIAYLNSQAAITDVAQVRGAIYTVLESEIKNVMLAKGPGDYALKVIDPAVAPELKTGPKGSLWGAAGFLLGFVLSMAVLYLRSAWRAGTVTGADEK